MSREFTATDIGCDATATAPAVSVVCPFFNEEAVIREAVETLAEILSTEFGDFWELILVNDGSTDRSLELLMEALRALNEPRVRILSYEINKGRGAALKTGIDAARADIIVTTEADCSWGRDIVKRLYDVLGKDPGCDFVIASVHLPGGGLVNVPPFRRFLTKMGNLFIRQFVCAGVSMSTGMTRAYRRKVIQPLRVREPGKEFHLEVLLKLLTIGFAWREIPATITWNISKIGSRKSRGTPRTSSTRIWRTIGTHLRFLAIGHPSRYFTVVAAGVVIVGIVMMLAAVWSFFYGKVSIFLAILGLLILVFGLLFTGFAVLFMQMRENMREHWIRTYTPEALPSSTEARDVEWNLSGASRLQRP